MCTGAHIYVHGSLDFWIMSSLLRSSLMIRHWAKALHWRTPHLDASGNPLNVERLL